MPATHLAPPTVVHGTAMGSTFSVIAYGGPDEVGAHASARIAELEARWSRFLPGSEVTRINAGSGPTRVSTDTVRLVIALIDAWRGTGGAFDPTLIGSLVGLGYGASRTDPARRTDLRAGVEWRGRPDLILVDVARNTVELPDGTALDPGGLGKGLAADIVVAELLTRGADAALVEIGGDLAAAGTPPHGAWTVALGEPPGRAAPPLQLLEGGVATSTTTRRRWQRGHLERHHLLDPSTGDSTTTPVVTATVIAGSAATAEAFTKLAFVRGAAPALTELTRLGLAAAITTTDGDEHTTPAWKDFQR